MNKPTLSAQALEITPSEHRALLEIRGLFATGTFKHDPSGAAEHPDGFNMNFPEHSSECGTSCCIGGWMWHAMNRDRTTTASTAGQYVNKQSSGALKALFFPPMDDLDDVAYDDITPGAALAAIDSFLTTGNPDWRSAVGLDQSVDLTA
ncbi:hypothetical protein [Bradyrhizobium sp. DASA03007]|uniref:hypothetical protein n=1 Tax=unclassified Bradyrhizobium TaxID=2631580 RepID=UPI003F71CA81